MHLLFVHAGVACAVAQTLPQPPQSATVLVVFVSQPFAALLSQSPKPLLQSWTVHVPAGQPAVPFATLQTFPQLPQLLTLSVFVSQPLRALPSQFAKPALQLAMPHSPATQLAVPFTAAQTTQQAPQAEVLFEVSTSQPLEALPSQSA